jgi:hypothetical protein
MNYSSMKIFPFVAVKDWNFDYGKVTVHGFKIPLLSVLKKP